jgi:ABC-type oligopeptide transport system substrate-binding subunit/class 3 adenylate cyclase/predicted Ser/Thr protein kinase
VTVDVTVGSSLAGYRVERLLGHGGMGAVYLAEDAHLHRKVAIKVLARELADDDRFRRRFLLESQLAASLEHPHIVPIYAAGEDGGLLFLAMKHVDGFDLRKLIDAEGVVGDERTLRLLGQIGDALDCAHGLGLVHRDVKPANILVAANQSEQAYLCDFGLARHAATAESLSGGAFAGTIAYIAPEQIEGGPVDARADVYSLGCVLFECLTGMPPFAREGDLQVVFAHVNDPPPAATAMRPELPAAVDDVVRTALAKAPDDRFSTAGELIAALGEALAVAPPAIAPSARRSIPGIRTFLFADIRGYTSYTAEHGDEAGAALATRFADVAEQVLTGQHGRLIQLRGDEVLVVFDSARQALRAALDLQARLAEEELPRGVGVGLDAGEAVRVADGYRGGALNLAARLCAIAGPGEILATETVMRLAGAVDGIRAGARRDERLKGFAEPVTAVEVLPAGRETARRRERRRIGPALARPFRSARVRVAAALALAVAGLTAVTVALTGSSSGPAKIAPEAIGFVSPAGKVLGQVPVNGSGDLGVLGRTLWYGDGADQTLERIDLRTRKPVHPFVAIEHGIASMATGFGAVWVVDAKKPTLLRIDPRFLSIERIPLPAKAGEIDFTAPTEVTVGAGSVWVAEANKVFRVDPASRRVIKAIDVPQADLVAFGDGKLWVGQSNLSSISQLDPAIDEVVKTVKLRNWVGSIAVGGGYVWATVVPDDTLWKIDQSGSVDKTLNVAHGPGDVAFFDGAAWLTAIGTIQRVDPDTDAITDHRVADRAAIIAPGRDELYVSVDESPPKLRPLPADRVATVSLAEDFIDDTDPGHAFPGPSFRYQLEYATGAQLLNYPDAPGPRGAQLRPEVARAMPTVSRDGRTYTFRVRPGFRFSPPSNEPVTAQTFKASIERALSPKMGPDAPAAGYVQDIAGAKAYTAGKASDIAGIAVKGDTLTIRLVAPSADFLTRLSAPFFAAVPIGTPATPGGFQSPIPSAGPYYVATKWFNELTVLERNPNYHGDRPRRLQRIVYEKNDSSTRTIARIEKASADYAADVLHLSPFAAGGPLDARYGPAHRAAAPAPRLVQTPAVGLRFLQFNTARGVFADARMRQAVNYAIDRRALAAAMNEAPSDAYVPSALQGSGSTPGYPMAPDLARARALARGARGPVTLYSCKSPECGATARIVRANLAPLALSVRVVEFDDPYAAAQRPGARYDVLLGVWFWDYPNPAELMNVLLDTGGYRPPWASARPMPLAQKWRRALDDAGRLTGPAQATAYQDVAARLARDVAPIAVYSTMVLPELFSARMACGVEHPVLGAVDLGTLCVR